MQEPLILLQNDLIWSSLFLAKPGLKFPKVLVKIGAALPPDGRRGAATRRLQLEISGCAPRIHDSMNTQKTNRVSSDKPLLTVAYLETLPDDNNRYELIAGELFVSCASGLPHQLALQKLQLALAKYLETNPIGIVAPGAGAVFSDYDSVIPDIAFVLNERWAKIVANERFIAAPNLVIEVVSSGKQNRNRDFKAKRGLYAKYGVEEYWIVDRENRLVTIFRLRDETLEETVTLLEGDNLTSPILPGLTVNVGSLFAFP